MTILENNGYALKLFLEMAVPFEVIKIQQRGGITQADIDRASSFADEFACCGDTLLFGGKPGEAGNLAGRLAFAIAVLSFANGETNGDRSSGRVEQLKRWLNEFGG